MAVEWVVLWPVAALVVLGALALGPRYPALVSRMRRAAVARGVLRLEPGRRLARDPARNDLSWLVFVAATWVAASPWIWGYSQDADALASDLLAAGALAALGLAAVVFPSLWALALLPALWLVIAPWLLGYGDAAGPVGVSDTVSGLVAGAGALSGLRAAERQVVPDRGGGVGRIRRRDG